MTTYYVDGAVGNDSNAGTSAGSGNAWATLAKAAATVAAGDTVNVKASATYTLTSAVQLSTSGTSGAWIYWIGYTSSPGDGGQATVTTATNSVDLIDLHGHGYQSFANFIFSSTAGTPGNGITTKTTNTSFLSFSNCTFSGLNAATYGGNTEAPEFLISDVDLDRCKVLSCVDSGFRLSNRVRAEACYFLNNTGAAVDGFFLFALSTNQHFYIERCTFAGNGRSGVRIPATSWDGVLVLRGNNFNTNGGDGVTLGATSSSGNVTVKHENNIYWNNGAYGINLASASPSPYFVFVNRNNFYGSNGTNPRNNLSAGTNDGTLTAIPWTNAAGNDYSLNSTAGGGAAARAAGYPGVTLFGTGYLDVGALQHQDSGGGSTGAGLSRAFLGMGGSA